MNIFCRPQSISGSSNIVPKINILYVPSCYFKDSAQEGMEGKNGKRWCKK